MYKPYTIRIYPRLVWMSNCGSQAGGGGGGRASETTSMSGRPVDATTVSLSCIKHAQCTSSLHQRSQVDQNVWGGSSRLNRCGGVSYPSGETAPPLILPLAVHIICIWIQHPPNFLIFTTQFFIHIHCSLNFITRVVCELYKCQNSHDL